MNWRFCPLVAAMVLSAADAQPQATPDASAEHASRVDVDRAGVYSAEGTAIVGRGKRRYHNRPLYCSKTSAIVLAGDLPHIRFAHEPYVCGCLMMAVDRSGKSKWLHDFSEVESRYQNARMTWRLSDPSLSGLTVTLEVVPMADAAGLCAHLAVKGAQPGDRLIWAYGGATRSAAASGAQPVTTALDPTVNTALTARGFVPEDCRGNTIAIDGDTFILSPPVSDASRNAPRRKVAGRCTAASSKMMVAAANAWSDPAALAAGDEKAELPLALGIAPLTKAVNFSRFSGLL